MVALGLWVFGGRSQGKVPGSSLPTRGYRPSTGLTTVDLILDHLLCLGFGNGPLASALEKKAKSLPESGPALRCS